MIIRSRLTEQERREIERKQRERDDPGRPVVTMAREPDEVERKARGRKRHA